MDNEVDKCLYDAKQNIISCCNNGTCGFDHIISFDILKKSVDKMKGGKIDPIYGINSFNIKHGSELLLKNLTIMCQLFLSHI